MSNSKINLDGDDRLLDIRRDIAGITIDDMVHIALIEDGVGDLVASTLDKYEAEIIRQREVIARLQNKVRNYRSGIKGLQRAHEATLHRLAAVQDTAEQYRAIAQEMCSHGGCQIYVDQESDAPYSPIRFNNEAPVGSFETVPASRVG